MNTAAAWIGVLGCAAGCYLFKILGLSVPDAVLERPLVRRLSALLPVALLSALVVVGTFADGKSLVLDSRSAGVAAAVVALLLRAPFLVVVLVAGAVAAAVHALS